MRSGKRLCAWVPFRARTHAQLPSTCSEESVDSTSVATNVLLSLIEQRSSPMVESIPPVSDTPVPSTPGEIVPATSIPFASIREAVAEILPTALNPSRDAPSLGKRHWATVVIMAYIHLVTSAHRSRVCPDVLGVAPLFSPRWAASGPSRDDKGFRAPTTSLLGSRDPGRSPHPCGLSPGRVPAHRSDSLPYRHTPLRATILVVNFASQFAVFSPVGRLRSMPPHLRPRGPAISTHRGNTPLGGSGRPFRLNGHSGDTERQPAGRLRPAHQPLALVGPIPVGGQEWGQLRRGGTPPGPTEARG